MNEYLTTLFSKVATVSEGFYVTSSTHTASNSAGITAAIWIMSVVFCLLIFIGAYVFLSICLSKIFKKAGIKSWIAWVPFYSNWKFFEMGSFHGALSLLILIPYVGTLVFMILYWIAAYRIGLKFHKDGSFVLLSIFLAPVWLGILAFDKSTWSGISANTTSPTESAK